jgi:hypothetical protein
LLQGATQLHETRPRIILYIGRCNKSSSMEFEKGKHVISCGLNHVQHVEKALKIYL